MTDMPHEPQGLSLVGMRRSAVLFLTWTLCAIAHAQGTAEPTAAPAAPQILMDFSRSLDLGALPPDWRHRTFWRYQPMQISWVNKAGRPAIRLATQGSASMLFRNVDVRLDRQGFLSWGWFVEQAVVSEIDELSAAGDDHPARLYLKFQGSDGQTHALEIIWGNTRLVTGDWKYLKTFWGAQGFPHYTARGGQANVGRWHDERVDLRALYRKQWGDPAGARLVELALFCDTDQTGVTSVAYFSNISVETSAP